MPYSLEHGFLDLPYTEMVWIEPDSFLFQEGEVETKQITFERGFWASKYPVTQELYVKVMAENPSYYKGKHRPVTNVTWNNAQTFLEKLNRQVPLNDSLAFQLPSEAMWEYSARSNEKVEYSGSKILTEVGWYRENSYQQTMPLGLKEPNEYCLYDFCGNTWKWSADAIEDWENMSIINTPTNGLPFLSDRDKMKALRGGSYSYYDGSCRIANRGRGYDYINDNSIGFLVFRY